MRTKRVATSVLMLLCFSAVALALDEDYDIVLEDVLLRPGVTADLHVKVYVNESHPCHDNTILALHGSWSEGARFQGLAEAMFEDNPAGRKLCRMAVLDLPGHGGSGLPVGGLLFGELTLNDYVTCLLAALTELGDYGVHPKTLIAQSMGGLVIQMAQQQLVDAGTDLKGRFNVKNVVLFATAPPAGLPSVLADQQSAFTQFFAYCFSGPGGALQPGCGAIDADVDSDVDFHDWTLIVPPAVLDCDATTTPMYNLPAPTPPDCNPSSILGDIHWNGAPESLTAMMEMVGGFQYQRPAVEAGIFRLEGRADFGIVSSELDNFFLPDEGLALYEYLTGDADQQRYVLATGPNAIHSMVLDYPQEMLEAIADRIPLP